MINFQKVAGSAHVAYDKEAYQLKYITPNITRFVMTQVLEALTVNTKRVEENIDEILGKMRRGAPDWTALPAQPPI